MNTNKIISELDAEQMGKELPEFAPGDTVVVQVKVKEGTRERLQALGCLYQQAQSRAKLCLHRSQDLPWRRRGAYVPNLQSPGG